MNSEPQIRPVTALFVDVVGSTGLAERLSPDRLAALMGDVVNSLSRIVDQHGGEVESFMGDGLAAFYGMTRVSEDDALRAVVSGLAMIELVGGYGEQIREVWGVSDLQVRVGINSGEAAVGPLGANRGQTVALGDIVNVAARLQILAGPGHVLIGSSTAEAVQEWCRLTHLGSENIRGRSEPVSVWRVDGISEVRLGRRAPKFVGRERELLEFREVLKSVVDGRGRILSIVGEAGLGKTALSEESLRQVSHDLMVVRVCCGSNSWKDSGNFMRQILLSILNIEHSSPDFMIQVECSTRLGSLFGTEYAVEQDILREMCRGRWNRVTSDWEEALMVLVILLERRIEHQQGPVAIVIDDLSKADVQEARVCDRLIDLVETHPLLIVLISRPEVASRGWSLRSKALGHQFFRTSELRMTGLSEDESWEFCDWWDSEEQLRPEVRRRIISRAMGNPLLLEELLRAETSGRSLTPKPVPDRVQALVLARWDLLPAEAKRVLARFSVVGYEIAGPVAAWLEPDAMRTVVPMLIRDGWLVEGKSSASGFCFRHPILRDVVERTVPEVARQNIHLGIGTYLESLGAKDLDRRLVELAYHFSASSDRRRALTYTSLAGERLLELGDFDEAIFWLESAKELVLESGDPSGRSELGRQLIWAYVNLGMSEPALSVFEDLGVEVDEEFLRTCVRTLLEGGVTSLEEWLGRMDAGDGASLGYGVFTRAMLAFRAGDFDTSQALAEALTEAPSDAVLSFELEWLRAGISVQRGDLARAAKSVESARGHLPAEDSHHARLSDCDLAVLEILKGNLAGAERRLDAALVSAERVRDWGIVQQAGNNLIYVQHLRGAFSRCRATYTRIRHALHGPYWRANVFWNLGLAELSARNIDRGDEILARARHVLDAGTIDRTCSMGVEAALAWIRHVRGESAGAERSLRRVLRGLSTSFIDGELRLMISTWLAEVLAARRGPDAGLAMIERSLGQAKGSSPWLVNAAVVRCALLSVTGAEHAHGAAADALTLSRDYGMRMAEGRLLCVLARMDDSRRDFLLQEAEGIFDECGVPFNPRAT